MIVCHVDFEKKMEKKGISADTPSVLVLFTVVVVVLLVSVGVSLISTVVPVLQNNVYTVHSLQ